MIYLYTGTPGSGKSLHVASLIYDQNVYGHKNFILNFEFDTSFQKKRLMKKCGKIVSLQNHQLTVEFLKDFARDNHKLDKAGRMIESQTTVVIDEAQVMFNARSWNAAGRMDWNIFFTQHRKYGFDIILVTQYDRLIDKQIRSCIEFEIKHRNISYYKIFGKILGFLTRNRSFCAVKYWYQVNERCDSTFFFYRKKIGKLYNSYKLFDSQEADQTVTEQKTEKTVQKRKKVILGRNIQEVKIDDENEEIKEDDKNEFCKAAGGRDS